MTLIARKLPFIFAAIFAAGFVASAANAAGFYINPGAGGNYIALDYPTSAEAEMLARQECRDNFSGLGDIARCELTVIGSILAFETNSILAYNRRGYAGMGATRQLAQDALFADCDRTRDTTECMTMLAIPAKTQDFAATALRQTQQLRHIQTPTMPNAFAPRFATRTARYETGICANASPTAMS